MADIHHHCNRTVVAAQSANPHFLLTNTNGDFLNMGSPNTSNYNGLFIRREDAFYKAISDIAPTMPLRSLDLDGEGAVRMYDNARQRFTFLDDGLIMESSGEFTLTADCKRIYDESDQGRVYRVDTAESDRMRTSVISYTKYLDSSLGAPLYSIHIAIATDLQIIPAQRWRQVYYSYDIRRGTASTPWVHDALILRGTGTTVICVAETADDALRRARTLFARKDARLREHTTERAAKTPTLPVRQQLAWRALDALRTRTGIVAGLPWFFQEWSRDELIALGGLLAAKEYRAVIPILEKWYSVVKPDGTLPAMYPDKGLPSSDAPGWLGKRTRDLLLLLAQENMTSILPQSTIARWRDATGRIIDGYRAQMRGGLIWSGKNTTWMDTSSNDDGRAGACIEIQALFLALFDAHVHLCAMTRTQVDQARSRSARELLDAVHTRLFIDGKVLDGLHEDGTPDAIIRPNAFIAWYIAPRLFSHAEWRGIFGSLLPELWLPWGGLSSIARSHPNYHARYTGEDVASYHRGDSWYFVNNMAAMALHAIDPVRFGNYVTRIAAASVHDLSAHGYAGHASELSNAADQEPAGCYAQAWSASTLLELLQSLEDNS